MAVRNRTAQGNQIHGFLLEYGIEAPRGRSGLLQRLAEALEDAENELPVEGRALLRELGEELGRLEERVATFDALLAGVARQAPAWPAADGDPRDRRADGDGAGGGGRRRVGVPATAARWRRGSAWCRGSTRPGGGRCCSGSASGATGTCARC